MTCEGIGHEGSAEAVAPNPETIQHGTAESTAESTADKTIFSLRHTYTLTSLATILQPVWDRKVHRFTHIIPLRESAMEALGEGDDVCARLLRLATGEHHTSHITNQVSDIIHQISYNNETTQHCQ